ncbi:MAG: Ig-like domain-containing protein [Solirubrobacterales bacterium]
MYRRQLQILSVLVALAAVALIGGLNAFGAPKLDVVFTTPARTTPAGAASETITISLPNGLTGPATVKLSSSSGSGVFRNATDTANVTSVTIAGGQTQASFRYRDTVAGKPTITATAMSTDAHKQWNGNINGSQQETVVAAALDHLTLSPSSATVASGVEQAYTATGFDKYGNSRGNVTAGTTFTIAPNGSCTGASCSAGPAGTHTVQGTNGTATGQATLTVTPGPLARIEISPKTATIESGGSQAYKVEGFDAAGNDLGDVTSNAGFGIAPDGSCAGATCGASQAGDHVVTATSGSFKDEATLHVEADAPTTVSLTFDDSRADQMEAGQILSEHGMAATFFVISGRVGASGYMSLSDLETLAGNGNEIADHTVNHLNLTNVNREEAERQVCNARVQLEAWGFHVWDFAYPQGGADAELEEVVRNCNLNSARGVSDLVSPGACEGCAYAETIPPQRPYKIRTPDSIKATTSLEELKGLVRQAQEHGGGWVPLVFHHVCDECDAASIDPETFKAFLDWLGEEAGNGVSVKTVHEVIGGEDKPLVAGPVAPPKSEPLPENPSLEEDANGNGVPDCWTIGSTGINTFEANRTADAHSGSWAEHVAITSFESGDKRLITTQDLGQCAPGATPTHTYTASAYFKGEGTMRWVAYLRNGQGAWSFWAQSQPLTPSTEYTAASWKTPQVPSWATAISFGISLRSVGSFTADDFNLHDNGEADQTPPSVSITAPENNATVEGTTPITADATDNVGVESVRFFLDGVSLGSKTTPTVEGGSTYKWNWDTTAAGVGTHTLTAVATDGVGNQTTSAPITVKVVRDTTAPTTTIQCNGSSTCTGWLKSPVSVTLKASDNVGVAATYYTTDGSEPSESNGTLYTGAFNVVATSEVKYRSVDTAGNWEATKSQPLQVDGKAPTSLITAPANEATVIRTSTVPILDEATDDVGVASVRFFLDGVSLGSKTTPTVSGGSTYKWNWDTTGVSEGTHTLTAVASDLAGNQTSSAPVTVTVVADTTPPSTTILCNGSSTCGNWFKAPVSVSLKATDNAALAGTYYTTDGSEPTATNGTLYNGAFTVSATATVTYRSVDASGNWETPHAQLIQIDSQAPSAKITSPASGATVTGTTPILAEATDNVSIASVRFFLDGVSLGSKTTPTVTGGSTYRWNWETGAVSKGSHTLTVVATDQAGNQTTSAPVTVTVG